MRPLSMMDTSEEFAASKNGRIRWLLALSVVMAVLGIAMVMFVGVGAGYWFKTSSRKLKRSWCSAVACPFGQSRRLAYTTPAMLRKYG